MKCPECERLEFFIEELTKQLEEERATIKKLKDIIRERGR